MPANKQICSNDTCLSSHSLGGQQLKASHSAGPSTNRQSAISIPVRTECEISASQFCRPGL